MRRPDPLRNDCAMCGESRFQAMPRYSTEAGAARALVMHGYGSVRQMVDAHCEAVPVASARRGDWVMRAAIGSLPGSFGVVVGQEAVHMSVTGLILLPANGASHAWSIG